MPLNRLTEFEGISTEIVHKTIIIRFIRPEIRSPLSVFVIDELNKVLNFVNSNGEKIEKIIFTGSEDVFASGADLREIAEITDKTAREFARRGQNLMNSIAAVAQTTIAAINGYCFGGALDLAVACDRRIAAPNAQFSHPGANLGIITGWSGTQRLPRLIGQANALEMFFTAKRIGAPEAERIGLIDEIAENPLSRALAICGVDE